MYKWLYLALFSGLCYFYFAELNQYKNTDNILPQVQGVPLQREASDKNLIRCSRGGYDWEITPLFDYEATAFVFGVSHNFLNLLHGTVPADLGLLWGDNARYRYYKDVKLRVLMNHYTAQWKQGGHFNLFAAANTHCATCNDAAADKLRSIVAGDQIRIRGRLINAKITEKGWFSSRTSFWESSTTREDTGEGSCEFLYVSSPDDIEILRPASRFNKYMFRFCFWAILALTLWLFIGAHFEAAEFGRNG